MNINIFNFIDITIIFQFISSILVIYLILSKKYNITLLYIFSVFLIGIIFPLTIYNFTFVKEFDNSGIKTLINLVTLLIFLSLISLIIFSNKSNKREITLELTSLTRISILIGFLAIFSSIILGYFGYYISKNYLLENLYQNNINKVKLLNTFINSHESFIRRETHEEKSLTDRKIQEIYLIWDDLKKPSLNSNLYIFDNNGNVIISTEDNNLLNRMKELFLINKENFISVLSKENINENIITYEYNQQFKIFIIIQTSFQYLNNEVYSLTFPLIIGFIFISIILLPLSLGLLQWAFSISQKKILKTQSELKDSEEKFRQMAENIRQVFWIYDIYNNSLLYINPSFETVLKLPIKTAYENPHEILKNINEDKQKILEQIENIGNKNTYIEFRYNTSSNEVKWISSQTIPIFNEENVAHRVVGIAEDITERKLSENKIKSSLKEKEILLKEIHHRVKNNLQVIYSLLGLQSKHIKNEEYLKMFQESQQRVRSMSIIHEKLYQTEDLSSINFSEYINNLISYLSNTYHYKSNQAIININVTDNLFLDIDTAIPCGLIINELFSNSLKYAKDINNPNIEINIEFLKQDTYYQLSVKDNGNNMSKDFDIKKTKSLGLKLVNTLSKQLKGKLEFSSINGTEFKITFPVKN